MTSTKEDEIDIYKYLNSLPYDKKERVLKTLGQQIDYNDMNIIKTSNINKRKKERKVNSLKKYRNSWKELRCKEEDLENEWVNDWWMNNKICKRNKINIGYQDIILGYNNNVWTAITGTDCEWFEEKSSLQDIINEVFYHNSSGADNWGAGTIGGSHENVDRIFINKEEIEYFERNKEIETLKNRYKKVYILDSENTFK